MNMSEICLTVARRTERLPQPLSERVLHGRAPHGFLSQNWSSVPGER